MIKRFWKWLTGLFKKEKPECKHENKVHRYSDNRVKGQKVYWCPDCFTHIFIKDDNS